MSSNKISPEGTNAGRNVFRLAERLQFVDLQPIKTINKKNKRTFFVTNPQRTIITANRNHTSHHESHFHVTLYLSLESSRVLKSACCSSSLLCFMMPNSLKCYISHQLNLKRGSDKTQNVLELLAIRIVQVRYKEKAVIKLIKFAKRRHSGIRVGLRGIAIMAKETCTQRSSLSVSSRCL